MREDGQGLPTPRYVIDAALLEKNLKILSGVSRRSGCKILLAQKAFSAFALYPLAAKYLDGTAASGLFEARLGKEEFGGETHVFSAAYRDEDFDDIAEIADCVVFNSFSQLDKFAERAQARGAHVGLRINPECSTQSGGIYDPCAKFSRLGVTRENFPKELPKCVSGFHFHTLCEQNSDALEKTLEAVVEKFSDFLPHLKWINFGGGHHITRPGYDIALLEKCIRRMSDGYGLQVYLEPGEAVALNAGFLYSKVLDIVRNGKDIAILDASAACHMPDVLEMPYRPPLLNAGLPGEKAHTYILASQTCLAGDVVGEYSFDEPLKIGDTLVFGDMAIYTMVKNNTFNGAPLPSIWIRQPGGSETLVKKFGYSDFKNRLS